MASHRWFVSPTFDMALIILTPIYSALFLLAFYGALYYFPEYAPQQDYLAYVFFLVFTGIFDAPHIFQTFTRTHLDSTEYNRRRIWHWIYLGIAICASVLCHWNSLSDEFLVFLSFYGTWHIIRQNLGFVRLYQQINKPLSAGIDNIEIHLHHFSIVVFYLFQTQALAEIFPTDIWLWLEPFLLFSRWLALGSFLLVFIYCIFKNALVLRKIKHWNLPKILFLFSNLGLLCGLIFITVHPMILIAVATIAHNIQYQAWVSVYNARRTQYSKFAIYTFIVCLLTGILFTFAPEILDMYYNGFVLWHYFIDGKIWRLSKSHELQTVLLPPLSPRLQ